MATVWLEIFAIFAVFPAIRKNKFPQIKIKENKQQNKTNKTTITLKKIICHFSRKNLLQSKYSLT